MKLVNFTNQSILPKNTSRNTWKAAVLLIAGLLLTAAAAIYAKNLAEARAKQEYALVCNDIKTKISTRLHAHAQLLRSVSAFFIASDTVTRDEWREFNKRTKINENLPGTQGIGFSLIIPKNQLQQHIQNIRKEGFPGYTIKPAGDRDIYTSSLYIEPFSGRNLRSFGFDMFSEPIRRKAMELSRDDDIASLSGKVTLVQEYGKDMQAGTLIYVPVYRKGMPVNTLEQRRRAIKGWVYSPNRMNDLMLGILGRWDLNRHDRIHLQVYDDSISVPALLYDSQRDDLLKHKDMPSQTFTLPIEFSGKRWILNFTQSSSHISYYKGIVIILLIGGIVISLLLFFLSLSLFNTRYNAQKIAEQLIAELIEGQERFHILLNSSAEAIYGLDPKGICTFANTSCLQMLGYESYDELLGKNMHNLIHYAHPDGSTYEINDCPIKKTYIDGKKTHEADEVYWRKDGTGFPAEYWSYPILIKGEIKGAVVSFFDITERKYLEEKLKANETLLQELNASKDRFISILAHDLRSPFNSIIGFLDLITENIREDDIDTIEKQLNIVNNSAKDFYGLLEDLLLWARAQSGKLPFEPRRLELYNVCSDIAENLKLNADNKNITITQIVPKEINVFADINMLKTVLRNLVSNAIKFTNKGGHIEISAGQNETSATITVSDNGIGIAPEKLTKLFDISQINTTDGTEKEKGTGLGLLLCKDLVEKQGGKIWVGSKIGNGSEFKFTMPVFSETNNANDNEIT